MKSQLSKPYRRCYYIIKYENLCTHKLPFTTQVHNLAIRPYYNTGVVSMFETWWTLVIAVCKTYDLSGKAVRTDPYDV